MVVSVRLEGNHALGLVAVFRAIPTSVVRRKDLGGSVGPSPQSHRWPLAYLRLKFNVLDRHVRMCAVHVRRPTKTRCVLSQQLTMTTSKRQAAIQKEGRIELALQAYQQGHFSTPTVAAKVYNVTQSTLQRCIIEGQPKLGSIMKNCLLMPTEEESLVQ